MEYEWLIPISMQGKKSVELAHFMPVATQTNALHQAICGRMLNPGFAKQATASVPRCFRCERRLK